MIDKFKALYEKSPALAIAMAVVTLIILLIIIKKISKEIKDANARKRVKDTSDGSKPMLSKAEISSKAKTQLSAMSRPGTKERILVDSIRNLNGADLIRVFNAFGVVAYDNTFGAKAIIFGNDLDLFGWYNEELKGSDKEEMQSVWDKTGMEI